MGIVSVQRYEHAHPSSAVFIFEAAFNLREIYQLFKSYVWKVRAFCVFTAIIPRSAPDNTAKMVVCVSFDCLEIYRFS